MRLVTFTNNDKLVGGNGVRVGALLDGGERILDFRAAVDGVANTTIVAPQDWIDLDGVWWPQALASQL